MQPRVASPVGRSEMRKFLGPGKSISEKNAALAYEIGVRVSFFVIFVSTAEPSEGPLYTRLEGYPALCARLEGVYWTGRIPGTMY